MSIIIRVLINAVALWAATLLPGITLGGATALEKIGTLLAVAVIFGVINGVLKPMIKVVGCGFYIATLGLISFVVNALLFLLVDWIATQLALPYDVESFWWALAGAIVVGVVSFVLSLVVPDKKDRKDDRRDERRDRRYNQEYDAWGR